MSTSRSPDELIHERFPLLWESDDTPDDVKADLRLTDTELGTRYRRGKQTRLDRYQQLEDALELRDARAYQATTAPVLEVLTELMGGAPTLLDAEMPILIEHYPADRAPIKSAAILSELRYNLSTVGVNAAMAVGDHRLDAVLTVMDEVGLDEIGVDLFREVITCLEPPSSLASLSERHGKTRQAMSVRRQRLARRLARTRGEFAIAALVRVIHQRLETVAHRPADDPFLSITLSPSDGEFPGAVDAVRLGLWLASPEGHGEVPVGYLLDENGTLAPR